jgi:hypothetical protein
MTNKYQVRAVFADEFKPFFEVVGTYRSQIQAEDAKEAYEDQEDAPNFMGCDICYLADVLE